MDHNEMKKHLKNIDEEKLQYVFEIKTRYNNQEISFDEARKLLKERISTLRPSEIAYIEQRIKQFDKDECRKENIQGMLNLFDGILDTGKKELDEDHPISRYRQENKALEEILQEIEALEKKTPFIINEWLPLYEKLLQITVHYSRKQNQLYPVLEQKGFDRPTTTMWTLDDFIKDEIKDAYRLLKQKDITAFLQQQPIIVHDVRDLISKEENVLYPTSLDLIQDDEFEQMKYGDDEIGYAWIHVDKHIKPDTDKSSLKDELMDLLKKHGLQTDVNQVLDVATGKLTLEQINLIYQHMPVDLSFVDENDIVKFYTDTPHRVFPRSQNVIGRDVKNCHPQKSVHIVEEIIHKFKAGEQSKAEFWINKEDIFIYIVYYAVRDAKGNFKGVLEMMQDATHIRKLEGSRTLLTWENEQQDTSEPIVENQEVQSETDVIDENTKIKTLLDKYSFLKDKLIQINPEMKVLNTPLARVMLPKATIKMMSGRLNKPVAQIIQEIQDIIQKHKKS